MARELHISPSDLDDMDYAEVKFYNDELAKYLKELAEARKRAMRK